MEQNNKFLLPASIIIASLIVSWAFIWRGDQNGMPLPETSAEEKLRAEVLPAEGVVLPVRWGDLGAKLVSVGVIDKEKIEKLNAERAGVPDELKNLLYGENNDYLKITRENANVLLNLFWALGLANKNPILEEGPMSDPKYGGADGFASTGGWTLSVGDSMDHYSRHKFFQLTDDQQALVEKVSKGIYRPCCNNPTYFPDCNHGMAMLGLLELMAWQGVSEEEMWAAGLAVNSYWFPDTYLTIATYLRNKGVQWKDANPEEILGVNYSSGSGYARILAETAPVQSKSGASCGV